MSILGGLPSFRHLVQATAARIGRLGVGVTAIPATGIDTAALAINAVPVPGGAVTVISGTSHSPTQADNGTTFIYTAGTTVTVTMPAVSTLTAGWRIGAFRQGAGRVDFVRSASDTIISQGAALTTLSLPSVSDSGTLFVDTANTRFFWRGFRSFESTEITPATSITNTQAHNLGVLPRYYASFLRNKTAELGFSVNDEVPIANAYDGGGSGRQRQIVMDATNGVFQTGTLGAAAVAGSVLNKTTPAGVIAVTTAANWAMFWRAWVVN